MNTVHMMDQAARHDTRPDSNEAKRLRARAYLDQRGITLERGSSFKYLPAIAGSSVFRRMLRRGK